MKIRHFLLTIVALAIIATSCGQKVKTNLKLTNSVDTLSYCLGADVANKLKSSSVEDINYDAFIKGFDDIYKDKELMLKKDTLGILINKYIMEIRMKSFEKNLEEGKKFLEENKKREGVITTESGLQYEIITEGTGKSPSATSIVRTHYRGTLLDGTVFDSSYENGTPIEFPLNGVIKGWTEGLQYMKEGGKYKLYLPTELAYGMNVRPGGKIQPNMALIFEIELIEVKEQPEATNN
ncbi:MAG: FKBP-type peptidyl-prolyl cis-trans isomerase [Bacteroidales bacterium]|jgi:FKBP-type peptidyl-prolyl cis-trans isomerase FklB|nr:FKBP-type peptidyl-prolyl cis-trans isomerase [Bacteroidales bacterium]